MSYEMEQRDRLARIETKLDILITDYGKSDEDHETRLRALERWRYALPTSIVLAIGSLAATLFTVSGGNGTH